MNVFMKDVNSRIFEWRNLRKSIENLNTYEQLENVVNWWSHAPLCKYVIDWDKPETWPTPWELISDNIFCDASLAYLMHQTLNLSGVEAELLRLEKVGDAAMAVRVGDYIINFSYNEIFTTDEIEDDYKITARYICLDGQYSINRKL